MVGRRFRHALALGCGVGTNPWDGSGGKQMSGTARIPGGHLNGFQCGLFLSLERIFNLTQWYSPTLTQNGPAFCYNMFDLLKNNGLPAMSWKSSHQNATILFCCPSGAWLLRLTRDRLESVSSLPRNGCWAPAAWSGWVLPGPPQDTVSLQPWIEVKNDCKTDLVYWRFLGGKMDGNTLTISLKHLTIN